MLQHKFTMKEHIWIKYRGIVKKKEAAGYRGWYNNNKGCYRLSYDVVTWVANRNVSTAYY